MSEKFRRFQLIRESYGEDNVDKEVAEGVQFSSGHVEIEWNRHAFPEVSRTEGIVRTSYDSVDDVEIATDGTVKFID